MRALLIVNPYATGVTEERVAAVEAALPTPVETVFTRGRGDGETIAREAGPVDVVYVFSGDGTFNEVINGLGPTTPLGLIPGGGTSVLPRALGLPRDPVAAARALARAQPRVISVGRANGRRFGFNAGIGLDAELVRRVDALGRRPDGRRPGDAAFVGQGLRLLLRHGFRFPPVLEIEGIGPAAFAFVANGSPYTYMGARGLRFTPHATFEGGLDLLAPVEVPPSRVGAAALWAAGFGKRHVRAHDADRIVITCHEPQPMQVDGEDVGDVDEVELVAERAALTVLA